MTGMFSLRWFLLVGILPAVALALALAGLAGLLRPSTTSAHDPHGLFLECPITEVAEGEPVDVTLVFLGHDEPGLVMGTYFSTEAGTAGPSDYVEQDSVWTGWWNVSDGTVADGVHKFDWRVETTDDDLAEFDETFTIYFGPTDMLVDEDDPARDGQCETTIGDNDIFELPSDHHQVSGIWSDGSTTWVSNWGNDSIYAYDSASSARRPNQDFETLAAAGNTDPHGIWSDGVTMWVADSNDPKLYAYDMETRERSPVQDVPLHADNARPVDIWSDGVTMWVADAEDKKIYAYNLAKRWPLGERRPSWDISFDSGFDPFGIWSDGSIMWVGDNTTNTLYAYNLAGNRLPASDIALYSANGSPRGIWSDRTAMYALQDNAALLFIYQMPLGITMSIDPTDVVEEWGEQRVAITVALLGGRSIPSDTVVDLRFTEHTTDDDFEVESRPSLTLTEGANSGTADVVFVPSDDDDDEGLEYFAITAIMTYPGTGEDLISRIFVPFIDNDPVLESIPDLVASPVAGETTQLRVSWGSVRDAEVYQVEWKEGTDPSTEFFSPPSGFVTATSGTITRLAADTTYTVLITAIDTDGGGAAALASSETTGKTLDAMGDVTVSATGDANDSLSVSWPAVNGATGYRVEWRPAFDSYTAVDRSDAATTTETIAGLTANTEYAVRVTALHTINGETADGDTAEAIGATGSERSVSQNDEADGLEAWLVTGGVNLGWYGVGDTVDDKPVTAFTMQWAESEEGPWATLDYPGDGLYCIPNMDWDYIKSRGANTMVDGDTVFTECYFEYALAGDLVVNGTTYYYRLIAHAEDVDSKPGPVFQARAEVGGL